MTEAYIHPEENDLYTLGNPAFRMIVGLNRARFPALQALTLIANPRPNWAGPKEPLSPVISIRGVDYSLGLGNMDFTGFELLGDAELGVNYRLVNGLEVTLHLKPSPDKPAWRSWVSMTNRSGETLSGITRFDAANYIFSTGAEEPQSGYVLGWQDGPRADAPGKQALPYKYGGWIPKFLYGEGVVIPPPPAGGWAAPVYRLVQERLEKLPLRSGKRSTYENQPWVTVLDPERQGGWFLGFEWSGTWRIDAEYLPERKVTTVFACTDANVHTLKPGESLVSPAAFLGLFAGGWDEAFNASRFYVDDEIIPKIDPAWPTSLHVYTFHNTPEKRNEAFMRREIDAAAAAGFETTYIETIWWEEGALSGDFSIGLGSFADSRIKFPMGLRRMSDYVHSKGMNFGLWFEIERVDLRTANRLRNPWKPEWLVQQKGYPYRSWCQHVFLLCLGVKAAADWALENLIWAVKEYNLDYIMFDSNEWAVCDDPTHDHTAEDGEWAQIQGYYYVMDELRKQFPNLMVMNSSGGSQRGDFGIARYSNCIHPHDNNSPSAKQRRFMHGTGCMYPTSYQCNFLSDYTDTPSAEGFVTAQPRPADRILDAERFEWRVLNRLLGYFAIGLEVNDLPGFQQAILTKANAFYRRIRKCTHGDRYVLAGPEQLYEPRYQEADNWEAYQYVGRGKEVSVVYFYRCLSPKAEFTAKLRGLDPDTRYHIESYSGKVEADLTGAELMNQGFTCHLDHQRNADILLLTRPA
jgi:alpha-galactosidase